MPESPLLMLRAEPASGLDPQAEAELFERYARIARSVAEVSGGITL